MDCHHDISVALMGIEWEGSHLVGVNQVREVLNAEESFVGFGDWDVLKRGFFALNFDPDCLIFYNFLLLFSVLLIRCLSVGPLGVFSMSCPSWGNIG